MKRIWFGIALMAALLVLGIGSGAIMEKVHSTQAESLDRAAQLALEGDWSAARSLTAQAKQAWDEKQLLAAALCDHELMDQVEGLFSQLEVFSNTRSAVSFSGTCVYLARQLEALAHSHSFTLENLF